MIGLWEASRIYAGLTWTRLKRGRLLWLSAVLLAIPVVAAGGLVAAGHWGRGLFDELLEVHFRFLVPFVPALLASPGVAEEIENKTFTFVFARPAPRPALVLGKYLVVVVPVALGVALSIGLTWLISMMRFVGDMPVTAPHLLRAELAGILGVVAFTALASMLGALFTRHPFVAVMGYLLIVEAGLGSAPIALNLLAVSWHVRNLAELPIPEVEFMAFHLPAWGSALAVTFVGGLGVGLASLSVNGADYHGR